MADSTTTQHLLSVAKALNNSDVAARNRALDPRGLGSPSPIFKTLILSLVSPNCVSTTFDPYLLCWLQQVAPIVGLESEGSPRAKLKLQYPRTVLEKSEVLLLLPSHFSRVRLCATP